MSQKRRGWVRLHEKGGKVNELPCHHNLEQFLDEWLSVSGCPPNRPLPSSLLCRTASSPRLPLAQADVYTMIQRRMVAAGIETHIRLPHLSGSHYYFYIDDADFGPLFLKVCSYAPWATKLCLNGHEWAKRQLEKKKIAYEALDNGFLSCGDPGKLQEICDALGSENIDRVFRKWLRRIPLPLRPQDRQAGYDWNLSI